MSVFYREFEPAPELRPLFASYWIFRAEGPLPENFEHCMPPDGAVSLFVSARRASALLIGPRMGTLRPEVCEGDAVYGVHLWPGAAPAMLGRGVEGLRDQVLPLASVMAGPWARDFKAAMSDAGSAEDAVQRMDRFWSPLAGRRSEIDSMVMQAVFAILHTQGRIGVGPLALASGLSTRQFRRRFVGAVGLSPKELICVSRMRASIVDALNDPQRRWVEVAAAHGYADQAHLIHEFRRRSGQLPESLLEQLDRLHPVMLA